MTGTPALTYLVRHAETTYSARHIINGSLRVEVPLSCAGEASAREYAPAWLSTVRSCRTSGFVRTARTAELLTMRSERSVPITADHRLNEVDYGDFEGGPWLAYGEWLSAAGAYEIPPGGRESWRTSVGRMLDGLNECLTLPGPRLVIGHGLLSSVVRWLLAPTGPDAPVIFPEVPCLTPLVLTDEMLRAVVSEGRHRWANDPAVV